MSDEIQRLVVEQVWDTTSVEAGSQVIDKALTRQQQALDSTTKMVERYNRAVGDMADAKRKASGGGGHGGHGGGGFNENFKWALHDLSEGRGTQGLFRMASAFGAVGMGATLAVQAVNKVTQAVGKAGEAYGRIEGARGSARESLGLGRESDVQRNSLYRPLAKILPAGWFDQGGPGHGERESLGAMAEQRGELQKQIEVTQQSRNGYWAKFLDTYGINEFGSGLRYEQLMNDKLFDLDTRSAATINRGSDADWKRATWSSREGALDKSKAQNDEEIAVIDDATKGDHPKYGIDEANARRAKANTEREIRDRDINLQHDSAKRAMDLAGWDIGDRERGRHVGEFIAQNHMLAAQQEEQAAPTKEAREAAHMKYVVAWDQNRTANQSWREEDQRNTVQKEIADYRGKAEDRVLYAAQRELELSKSLLAIEKEKGEDAEKAAKVQVAAAQRVLDLLEEQQAITRIGYATQAATGENDVWAAGARLGGYSPEQATRFGLYAHVQNADVGVRAAAMKWAHSHGDDASRAGLTAAVQNRQKSQIALDTYDMDFKRDRRREMTGAQGETESLRWSSYGRHDLAQLTGQRTQSRLAIEDAEFHSNPDLADEKRVQQGYHERGALVQKYLNPDGTRRNPADVQAEELEHRRRQTRIDQFFGGTPDAVVTGGLTGGNGIETTASRHLTGMSAAHDPAARLAAMTGPSFRGTALSNGAERVGLNAGLLNVEHGMDGSIIGAKDALTGEHLNAQQVAEHMHTMKATAAKHAELAKDDRSDREIQQEIFKVLDARLPKDP